MKKLSKILFEETDSFYAKESPAGSSRKSIKDFYLDDKPKFSIYVSGLEEDYNPRFYISLMKDETRIGSINMTITDISSGPCLNALEIVDSKVSERGWGPILYEVALEIASSISSGLMSDRSSVSQLAQNVWDKFNSRSDIQKLQLDDLYAEDEEKLTPTIQGDDCQHPKNGNSDDNIKFRQIQDRKLDAGIIDYDTWNTIRTSLTLDPEERDFFLKSSLTKVYRKNNATTIKNLFEKGLIYFSDNDNYLINKLGLNKIQESVTLQQPKSGSSRKWAGTFGGHDGLKFFAKIQAFNFPETFVISIHEDTEKRQQVAVIEIEKNKRYGNCADSYLVNYSRATQKGWGPVIYEIAIEVAGLFDSGLMADRSSVSQDATNIWRKLISNANYSIDQLDDIAASPDEKLTPEYNIDDCHFPEDGTGDAVKELVTLWKEKVAQGHGKETIFSPLSKDEKLRKKFIDNPLSKSIRTNSSPILDFLTKNGRLFLAEESAPLENILTFNYDPYSKNRKKVFNLDKPPRLKEIYENIFKKNI